MPSDAIWRKRSLSLKKQKPKPITPMCKCMYECCGIGFDSYWKWVEHREDKHGAEMASNEELG